MVAMIGTLVEILHNESDGVSCPGPDRAAAPSVVPWDMRGQANISGLCDLGHFHAIAS